MYGISFKRQSTVDMSETANVMQGGTMTVKMPICNVFITHVFTYMYYLYFL